MIKLTAVLSIFLLFATFSAKAQELDSISLDSSLIQLSGVVVSEETLAELPYTTVLDRTSKRGVFCDYYGYFTMVVYPGDTLIFSAYGHKTSNYVVPDTLEDNFYSIIHVMEVDTIDLPNVEVYPWPSREDFARAFVNMDPYDDAIRRAQRQLSGESLAFAAARLDIDGSLAYGTVQSQYQTKLYTQNQLPANNLLNPYAWSKLIKDWKEGKLSKQ
ncbi:MAG: hypothetical protein HWE22_01990 [Flavobacteriales bacterium]|nr:hypothetical protein [Flavobacteriales bacterium]